MSAPVIQIEKLDDNNYDSWSIQMKSVLIHGGFWKIVSGQLKNDSEGDIKEKWQSDDEKALASICLGVKPTQLGYIRNCNSSHEAWTKLQDVHMPRGPLQKVSLYKRLVNLSMPVGGNVVQHMNEFAEISEKLAESGIQIQEELLVIMLLSSLPKGFDNFVIAMETRDDLPSFPFLKQKLLEEGKRRKEKSNNEDAASSSQQQAFIAKSTHTTKDKKSNRKFKGKCFICGLAGHYASNCEKKGKNGAHAMTVLASAERSSLNPKSWYVDSGATSHMCNDSKMFVHFQEHNEVITLAGNKHINASGKGDVLIYNNNFEILLQNVLFSSELQANFISVNKVVDYGLSVTFNSKKAVMRRKDGTVVLEAQRIDNMFVAKNDQMIENVCAASNINNVWHNRYGHLNFKSLQDLSDKSMVKGIGPNNMNDQMSCKTCMLSKIHVLSFPKESSTHTEQLLQIVHSDVCGPFKVKSVGGAKYFVTFIDDRSRRIFVYFIKSKSEVFEKFQVYKAHVEKQTGCKIKALRTDNGGEYINNQFESFLSKEGISRQLTVPYTPQQNGVAERANRTLVEMARSMMVHAGVKEYLWAEAVNTAAYIRNRCPTKLLENKTPYEVWFGRKPNVQHFRTFGAYAVSLNKTAKKSKFEAKGTPYIMVGYSMTSKAYRLFDTRTFKVVEQRDVLFDEDLFNGTENNNNTETSLKAEDYLTLYFSEQIDGAAAVDYNSQPPVQEDFEESFDTADDDSDSGSLGEQHVTVGPGRPRIIRSGKPGRPKKQYNIVIL